MEDRKALANPFIVTIGAAGTTVKELCWDFGVSVAELVNANPDFEPFKLKEGEAVVSSELRIEKGAAIKLPMVLQQGGNGFGSTFHVEEFQSTLNRLTDALDALKGDTLVPPKGKETSPLEKIAQAIAKDAERQTQVLRTQPSKQEQLLIDAVDLVTIKTEIAQIEKDFAQTPLTMIQNNQLLVSSTGAEGNASKGRTSNTKVTKALTKNIVNESSVTTKLDNSNASSTCGKSVQLSIDVCFPQSTKVKESWLVTGEQYLTAFVDAMECPIQLVSPLGEQSKNSFLFVGNTFFVDTRHENFEDLSAEIRKWDPFKQGAVYGDAMCEPMQDTKFADLNLKLNEMCVYRHMGNCDHYFYFNDVSALVPPTKELKMQQTPNPIDIPVSNYFPRRTFLTADKAMLCDMCNMIPANNLVWGDRLTPRNPTVFCPACYHIFHCDKDGKECFEKEGYVRYELKIGQRL